jgi:PhzF family phenazine biosynthesis protein
VKEGVLHRITAFSDSPSGGNPAGVWVGEQLPDASEMQRIAAEVGFSETAFVAPSRGLARTVRYYSPEAEVSFCGHATIAAGSVLGSEGEQTIYRFSTPVGEVPVTVSAGGARISLTSVNTKFRPVEAALLDEALQALRWQHSELDVSLPSAIAYAGAWHLVLAVSDAARLGSLDYDFGSLKNLMLRENLTTLQLIWREKDKLFHSRNPFPVGGVVEDPATGASAAALGGYLRDASLIETPFEFAIRQGEAMGRPSLITVSVPPSGGITVTGNAVAV